MSIYKSSHFFTQNTWDLVKKINRHAPPPKKEPKEKIENRHTEPDGLIISYQYGYENTIINMYKTILTTSSEN